MALAAPPRPAAHGCQALRGVVVARPGGSESNWILHQVLLTKTVPSTTAVGVSRAPLVAALATVVTGAAGLHLRRRRRPGIGCSARSQVRLRAVAVAEAETSSAAATEEAKPRSRGQPLQIVKIDLDTNRVVLDEEKLSLLEEELRKTGLQKVAIIGVMGAFRTGKSFLLDLMLRYLKAADEPDEEECVVPDWAVKSGVPEWALRCGESIIEGREQKGEWDAADGFLWRPGMEKCTEGVWIWSEAFVRKAGDEDVAVLIMDTQGAWDARMTQEQSATVFGLTTLMASRLIYNVSRQIQQDKIDNLLYFTDFAQAALRTKEKSVNLSAAQDAMKPFQTLEFLVRDWPHYPEQASVDQGRTMMVQHLSQYMDPNRAEDTESIDKLRSMFDELDVWCLPHPSLIIERESWTGDLQVLDPSFWRFIDPYFKKIFDPETLRAKTTLGSIVSTDTFCTIVREFILAFRNAAPQAQTFAQAMETSTSLLAKSNALKSLRQRMAEKAQATDEAITPDEFEVVAKEAAEEVRKEFQTKAIFGSAEGIEEVSVELDSEIADDIERFREENERRLEAQLSGLTNISLVGSGAFVLDRASDFTCDWWSSTCVDVSNYLGYGYIPIALFVAYNVSNLSVQQGSLSTTVAVLELFKSMSKQVKNIAEKLK